MGRPVYPYELGDPDFSWLLATYQEANPDFKLVDISCLPLILIKVGGTAAARRDEDTAPYSQLSESDNDDEILEKNE